MNDADQAPAPDQWLTTQQVGAELQMHPATIRLWLREGQIEGTRTVGGIWLVRRSVVEAMLAERSTRGRVRERSGDPYAPPRTPGAGVLDTLSEA